MIDLNIFSILKPYDSYEIQDIIYQSAQRMQVPSEREKELDFNRFCSYSITDVLGVSVESEYLYIVQAQKISVYEYHGNTEKPQLSMQLIHNKIILDYSINKNFICVRSASLIQVRDRKYWEDVVFTYQLANSENFQYMQLQGNFLYVSQKDNGSLVVEKIDIDTKKIVSLINLGKLHEKSNDVLKKIKPIFLNQLGMLNDFYIWAKTNQEVELGMLYTNQGTSKRKFQINQIEVSHGKIHQMYHHKVNCIKYPNQSPQYVILLVEKDKQKQIYLHLYEILPGDKSKKMQDDSKISDFQGQFQGILNQFSFLKNLHEKSTSNSLVQQVFSEAIAQDAQVRPQNAHFQVKIDNILNYQTSFYENGKLWVVSEKKICEIELAKEESIENIVKSYRSQQKVIKSMQFQDKPLTKQCLGQYKQKFLFSQITNSFDIAYNRDSAEEIAQEIEQYEINDEILEKEEKEAEIKITSQAERLRRDFLRYTMENNQQQFPKQRESADFEGEAINRLKKVFTQHVVQQLQVKEQEKIIQKQLVPSNVLAQCFSQTQLPIIQIKEYGTQTIEQKSLPLGLQQIQDLVAKYSSAFTVSCAKVKQNNYLKDKFDRQIFNIVQSVVKDSVHPFLQSKFFAFLQDKIRQISQHISSVFENQLQGLNEIMRKNETKENNLRGRRIFEFSNQVNYIKQTVSNITDSLKANEIHKHAFNELILEEAKEMKEEINKISKLIIQIDIRSQVSQKEINEQISQLFQLLKTLEEKQKENIEEDSVSCSEASENQSEQREIKETSEEEDLSQDSQQQVQREQVHYRYPYPHYPNRGVQEHKKNKKSFDALDHKGYTPYPPPDFYHAPTVPQMPPYYYPFMPQVPSMPMHGYYHSNYQYPPPLPSQAQIMDENVRIQGKRVKTSKKSKKEQ